MQEIEFDTKSQNGLINIPDAYKDWHNDTIKVVLLKVPQKTDNTDLKQFFDQFNADITNYCFNREKANER